MKSLNVTIRPFEAVSDTEKLSRIWLDASLDAHSFVGKQRLLEQQRLIEEEYLPSVETWVAVCTGEPVGFISLLGSFVGGLFVAPGQQGQGIGRKLIGHALARKGELTLEVYLRNRQAVQFYEGLGFVEVSRRANDDSGLPFENAYMELNR